MRDRSNRSWLSVFASTQRVRRLSGGCRDVAGANQPVAPVGMRSFGDLMASSGGIRRCTRIGVMTRAGGVPSHDRRLRLRRSNEARGRPRSTPAEHVWLLRSNICRHMTNHYPHAKIRPAFGSPTTTASADRSDRKKLLVSVPDANVCRETGCATRPIPSVPPKHMQPDEGLQP